MTYPRGFAPGERELPAGYTQDAWDDALALGMRDTADCDLRVPLATAIYSPAKYGDGGTKSDRQVLGKWYACIGGSTSPMYTNVDTLRAALTWLQLHGGL